MPVFSVRRPQLWATCSQHILGLSVASTKKKRVGAVIGERKRPRVHCDSAKATWWCVRATGLWTLRLSRLRYRIRGLRRHTKYNIRYQKSDSSRNIVVCARAGCPFRVYAVLSGNRKYVSVGHRCGRTLLCRWIIDAVALSMIEASHKTKKNYPRWWSLEEVEKRQLRMTDVKICLNNIYQACAWKHQTYHT